MRQHYRKLEEGDREKLSRLLRRAANNENVSKSPKDRLFGREFQFLYNLAVDLHRKTRDRRESGHPTIVHTLEVALGMLGYANSYWIEGDGGRQHPINPSLIVTPYSVIQQKTADAPDYEMLCLGTCILHDSVEDTSKGLDDIERNLEGLLKRLQPLGDRFSNIVTRNVSLLTNRYSTILKEAQRRMPKDEEPLRRMDAGLEAIHASFPREGTSSYVTLAERLRNDLAALHRKAKARNGDERQVAYTHTTSVERIADYLSYRAYDHFIVDILRDAQQRFVAGDATFDIAMLAKRQDAHNNIETMNLSTLRKIKRALAKAEMVQRHLDSHSIAEMVDGMVKVGVSDRRLADYLRGSDPVEWAASDEMASGSAESGLIQFLEQHDAAELYTRMMGSLALDLRYLMIRSCVIRTKALSCLDADSVHAQMAPRLERLEGKYRDMYDVHEGIEVHVTKSPLARLWKPASAARDRQDTIVGYG